MLEFLLRRPCEPDDSFVESIADAGAAGAAAVVSWLASEARERVEIGEGLTEEEEERRERDLKK